ncbi:MAG: dihydroxy-acid dehydratase [Peptostreptococcaceae bacterium]|nr:dihydroxy-acid dehydratase [Peptostreptococcaceae bacterium]
MAKLRSQKILEGPQWANVRALYKSSGYSSDELKKPIIAVVNSYNSICPGHVNLKQLAVRVKEGIYAAGGTPIEFGTIGACDGIAMGHVGMKYILPGREAIADDIEIMAEAHQVDGLVLLGSCDKIVPGMIMGALRLNIPSIFINGGPTLPGHMTKGNLYGGTSIDHSFIQESEGAFNTGKISKEAYEWIEDNAVPTIGSCAMLGTANTMCCLTEVMGLSLPGSSTIPAVYSKRSAVAFETGKVIVDLVNHDVKPSDIITRSSLENSIMVNSAIGGSTNAVLHILAIAYTAGIALTIDDFEKISNRIPHLVPMIPAGKYTLLDFYNAGGIPSLLKEMASKLNLNCLTCTEKTVAENLDCVKIVDEDIIRSLDNPVHSRGGIAVLYGNIAPHSAITKPSAIPENSLYFSGKAKIYESEEDALRGIRANEVKENDVVVIRNEGPKGSPGMPEMYKAMKLLVGMGLGDKVCLITDGRFSGSNNGCFIGHICPEAYDDGPIAYLENGDDIVVDVKQRTIDAPYVDFTERRKVIAPCRSKKIKGHLFLYQKTVETAAKGAYLPIK